MKDKILSQIKKMNGSLLGIGIDDEEMLNAIEENDKIDLCYILSNNGSPSNKKFKIFERGRQKKINIKKLKKHFRKKSIDNILCDYNTVKKFLRSFIPGSVYINKGYLYIYGNERELDNLKEKYQRYTSDIKLIKKDKTFMLIINNQNAKSNILKDNVYKVKDLSSDMLDILTDLLTN